METINRINIMRKRAIEWFKTVEATTLGKGIYTNSSFNKDLHNTDMLLSATYNATNCLNLLGVYEDIADDTRESVVRFFKDHLDEDGFFKMWGMKQEDVYYPTMEYVNFHVTNYVLGALSGLKVNEVSNFSFLKDYNSKSKLDCWLSKRDLGNPWSEGNYVVNLASFFIYAMEHISRRKYQKIVHRLYQWHLSMQDPATGYWYDKKSNDLVSAMAGAAHNYHLFYYLDKPIPFYERIIDHCLTILTEGVSSACLDIDVVDILANMLIYGYRADEIKEYLLRKLNALLDFQNTDGGFPDVTKGTWFFDGWEAYKEPQGISNCHGTWFRCASIGMISCVLFPETKAQWHFRDTIGMGYFNKSYLEGVNIDRGITRKQMKPKRIWLKAYKTRKTVQLQKGHDAVFALAEISTKVCEQFNKKDLSFFNNGTVFVFHISNIDDACFAVKIDNDKAVLAERLSVESDVEIYISDSNLMKVIDGKLMPVVAYATKKLGIKGDMTLALKLQNLF